MFYSVHIYGADVQLLQWNTRSSDEAKKELIDLMETVPFDSDEDDVKLFEMKPINGFTIDVNEGEPIFDYAQDHLQVGN